MTDIINKIVDLDFAVEKLVLLGRTEGLNSLFYILTFLGNWIVIAVLFIITVYFLRRNHKNFLLTPFVTTVIGSGVLSIFIKSVVGRARPTGDVPLYIEKLSSFPSAHAALSLAFFGFLAYCVCRFRINLIFKIILILVCILVAVLVGYTRVYLGVHYFSDVLAGYLVGLLWILVGIHLASVGAKVS